MIVLPCSRQLSSVFAKLSSELLQVFPGVLTWEPELDRVLEVFKPFDRSRLDCLEELKPNNWEWIRIFEFLSYFVAQRC